MFLLFVTFKFYTQSIFIIHTRLKINHFKSENFFWFQTWIEVYWLKEKITKRFKKGGKSWNSCLSIKHFVFRHFKNCSFRFKYIFKFQRKYNNKMIWIRKSINMFKNIPNSLKSINDMKLITRNTTKNCRNMIPKFRC